MKNGLIEARVRFASSGFGRCEAALLEFMPRAPVSLNSEANLVKGARSSRDPNYASSCPPRLTRRKNASGSSTKRNAGLPLSRNVGQPDHILADPIISHKAEPRPGSGEIWLAVTKHDGVQVDSILIDQAKFGEALRQVRASNFDLPVALGLERADRALKIILNKPGVGTDRLQRSRDDPFRLVPPHRRESVFICIPFRMIVVPVAHDLIHVATVHTARLPLSLLDEAAEERGAWRKRQMVDVAVQGLVHSEHELSHAHVLSLRGTSARF